MGPRPKFRTIYTTESLAYTYISQNHQEPLFPGGLVFGRVIRNRPSKNANSQGNGETK